ncbi:MAG: immunoglobulin domain-containing protein [Planctomycetes bacterium]|nr:immunoglobulin domain-containing protein [Planctomycetota bacterium]
MMTADWVWSCGALLVSTLLWAASTVDGQWQQAPAFPDQTQGRLYVAGLNHHGTLYAIGGTPWGNGADMDGLVHYLSPGVSAWASASFLGGMGPVVHQGVGVDSLDRIVVFGGVDSESGDPGPNKVYDPIEGPTASIASRGALAPADNFAFCTDDQSRIYALGGGPGRLATLANPNRAYAQRYAGATSTWQPLASMVSPVAAAAAVYDGQGHILVLGGFNTLATARSSNVARYDVAADTWSDTAIPDLPVGLTHLRAVLGADQRVYAIGGVAGPVAAGTVQNAVYVLDLNSNTWSSGPGMITPRETFAVALSDDHYIYAMGGDDGAGGTWKVERLYTPPCPAFAEPPASTEVWQGQAAVLTAVVSGGVPMTYRWRKDGSDLTDGPAAGGGTIVGATTTTLVIQPAGLADAGQYDLVATNPCGTTTGDPATLTIRIPPAIPTNWTVTNLHPAWALFSRADSISGGQQVGSCGMNVGGYNNLDQPTIWSGTASSAINLTPSTSVGGYASATTGDRQAGWWWWPYSCYVSGHWYTCYSRQAAAWSGSPGSLVNLQVSGWEYSLAGDMDTNQIVGTVTTDDESGNYYSRAVVWSLPSYSVTWLHPASVSNSLANAVADGHQYGQIHTPYPGPQVRAAMWSGSAASFVDMHPAGASRSWISGAGDGEQVGSAEFAGQVHAGLWTGSALGFQDINPSGATGSDAQDTLGGLQVGSASLGTGTHAGVWAGTAASFFDLHPFVPAGFLSSYARGLDIDAAGHITVVGAGYNATTGREEALLWRYEPHVPSDLNHDAHVDAADLDILIACGTGPAVPYDPMHLPDGCRLVPIDDGTIPADFDRDRDVDQNDFAAYQRCYSGSLAAPDPGCAG